MTESGSLIKSVELYDLVKRRSDSTYDCLVYNQVKTGSLELQAEGEEVNQSQSLGMRIVIGLSFRFSFQLRQYGFH